MPTPWRAAAASSAGSSTSAGQLDEHVQPAAAPRGRQSGSSRARAASSVCAALCVAQAHPPQVALELAAGDEVGERELAGDLRACVLDRLRGDQRPREPRRRQHPAQPHPRCQPLARRADVEDAVGREALQRADALVAELGVVVVLDDQPVAALGPLDQRRAATRAQRDAGRELVRRGHDDGVGAACARARRRRSRPRRRGSA